MSAALLILGVIAYLAAGLWVSRNWYRRLPPRYNPFKDEEMDAAVLVFIWPIYLVLRPICKALKWFYTGRP